MHPVSMCGSASIGFRLHTGWATLVAVAKEGNTLRILHRCRVELLPTGTGRFVYHEPAELPFGDAERLIDSIRHTAEATAWTNIRSAIENLNVTRACISTGSASVSGDLRAVLQSHARIHAAERAQYFDATVSACNHIGIPLITVRERDVWRVASANTRMSEADLKARIDAVRQTIGPPWTADHKIAAAATLVQA
jgi:hypothetical protein